jgi:hypothetical protein
MASSVIDHLKNVAALVESGGEITLGNVAAVGQCVASASDEAQCLAMLVRRKGESLQALLKRPDAAIHDAYEHERFIDEVNAPGASHSRKPQR